MAKDLSLLRPFDLEAAKRGELLVSIGCEGWVWKFAAGPDIKGKMVALVVENNNEKDCLEIGELTNSTKPIEFRMAPLFWLEDKPVYKGDFIFEKTSGRSFFVDGVADSKYFTWNKPKEKKHGYINLYPLGNDKRLSGRMFDVVFESEEMAKINANSDCIACVRVDWEE